MTFLQQKTEAETHPQIQFHKPDFNGLPIIHNT